MLYAKFICTYMCLLHYCIIECSLLFSIFPFECIQTVYTTYVYWNTIFHWHFNKYTSGISYILVEFQHITGLISRGWYSEVFSSHCISLLHDRTLISIPFYCIYTLYTVYTLCLHCHMGFMYTIRIHLVYLWHTSLHKWYIPSYNRYIGIQPGTHLVSFSKAVYTTIIHLRIFKRNISLSSQSLADACCG